MLKKQSETISGYVFVLCLPTWQERTNKPDSGYIHYTVVALLNFSKWRTLYTSVSFSFSEDWLQYHLFVTLVELKWMHLQQIMRETIAYVVDRARLRVRLKPRPDIHHRCTTTHCREITVETCVCAIHYNLEDTNFDRHSHCPLVLRWKTKQWQLSNCAVKFRFRRSY